MFGGPFPKLSNRQLGVGEYGHNSSHSQLWHCLAINDLEGPIVLPPEE